MALEPAKLTPTHIDTVDEPRSHRGLDSVWYAQTKEIARPVLSERRRGCHSNLNRLAPSLKKPHAWPKPFSQKAVPLPSCARSLARCFKINCTSPCFRKRRSLRWLPGRCPC